MWVPKEVNFYTHFFDRYLPRLEVKSSEGNNLQILPLSELALSLEIDEETLLKRIKKSIGSDVSVKNIAFVLLPKHSDDDGHYEEIILTWSEEAENIHSSDFITKRLELNTTFLKVGGSSFYVDVELNDKYRFESTPDVNKEYEEQLFDRTLKSYRKMPENEYHIVLFDKRHYVYRFERGLSTKIQIKFRIGVTELVKQWSWVGLFFGIGVLPFLALSYIRGDIVNAAPLGIVTIGLLVGFRILLLHDSELLKRWNWIYIGLVILDFLVLGILRVIGSHDSNSSVK